MSSLNILLSVFLPSTHNRIQWDHSIVLLDYIYFHGIHLHTRSYSLVNQIFDQLIDSWINLLLRIDQLLRLIVSLHYTTESVLQCKSAIYMSYIYMYTCMYNMHSSESFFLQKTPYQGSDRVFGRFRCTYCNHRWSSCNSWANSRQRCTQCGIMVYPYSQEPLNPSAILCC